MFHKDELERNEGIHSSSGWALDFEQTHKHCEHTESILKKQNNEQLLSDGYRKTFYAIL